ncbi:MULTISPECIES: cobyric acid synthase [Pseudoalteromonas]|uniref:Cobyric acid synthase n=1 Tax=Pseudoalteromonas amylolytica TaxID=1859457 RepID=A0A1S1MYA8_9GAMM|nr:MULTISPECIES: cobyric acid synthase [Pseudoalteromonas]OHU89127.1 cobyric acid synthase CobQ [Pseudoalteromonas sp. JW3]OHU92027.1 cobyric acid synthase CobQ [Pseudoalteromonas amylolytica]
MAKTLMVQGTTSDAGKSTLVAGLCRVFARRGMQVAPFKPQNMALNSAVTPCGGEIGRAQALQAVAAKVALNTDFNPILLKPNSDTGAQVIIHGRAISNMEAAKYHDYKKVAMQAVLQSHQRLEAQYELILVEGAGSPAEINLRENDIANMGFACAVDCPVIIVADIDKGGVFAHLVGTLALLSEQEQALVKGFVINRFRGDISLLQSGLDWLEEYTGKPVLGVMPYLHALNLDAEDAVTIENHVVDTQLKVSVLLLPHISNHTDFDSLRLHPNVDLTYVRHEQQIGPTDLIIIPGSKNVLGDMAFVKTQSWQAEITRHLRFGGKLLGVCGGLQMLGQAIYDPEGIESSQKQISALNLAQFTTTLGGNKTLTQVSGQCLLGDAATAIKGYEIHCGISEGKALNRPFIRFTNHPENITQDGFISGDNQIVGTYLHGLFDTPDAANVILAWASDGRVQANAFDLAAHREQQLERLADTCEQHLDIDKLLALASKA